ncbi:MAG: amylo-alpha-1,6-glucosidase, partial [Chloroflexota bacterium]|nr:amylo-alpha-1,6-glucosidase [Chloroflexota bacterium]
MLARAIFDLTDLFVSNRLPEVIGGLPRDQHHPHPGIYPESHEPQGWSASMIVMLVQALLGLYPIAPLGIVIVDPHLPEWLPDLRLSGVRVGTSVLDLEFLRRANGATDYHVVRRRGRARVVR